MPALNFPDGAVANDVYTHEGVQFTYNGTHWTGKLSVEGSTGSQGSAGSQGAQGNTGAAGSTGSQGITGATGATGAAGDIGDLTDTGNLLHDYTKQVVYYGKADEAITKGDVVMFGGVQGDHILFLKADMSAPGFIAEWVMGIAKQTLSNGAFGYVIDFGVLTGIDTSGYTAGDLLYVDPNNPGDLTTTEPTAPDDSILIAAALNSTVSSNGALQIRLTHKRELDELHGVSITSKTSGNILSYDGSNWVNTSSPTLNILKIDDGVHETFQAKADATGVVTHDCSLGHIFYHTSPDANWTANFTNLNLSSGYATTTTLVIVQGGTGYYPSAVQIGGSAQTISWQGNATPVPSTNRTDVVTFSILNNSGTYVVLGQLTGF